jgi:chromosome segregation ATPase
VKIEQIKASAGRTFNHPYEQYSNLRCDVHLDARLEDGEDPVEAVGKLQAQVEELAEGHKQALLKNLHTLQRIAEATTEISELERRMQHADGRLKELRQAVAAYQQAPSGPFRLTAERDRDEEHDDGEAQ